VIDSAAYCDLHTHSSASDGTDRPQDLPKLAKAAGLDAFALTDHDTTAGLPAAAAAAKRAGVAFVPGIELSADPDLLATGDPRGTLHILGYFIRHDDAHLARIQQRLRHARAQRNPEMVARLNDLGVRIDYAEVVRAAGGDPDAADDAQDTIVGRPHIAQVMVGKGYVKTIHEAFAKYIGMRGAAYIRKDRLSAAEAIEAIHAAGGLACFAHPAQLGLEDEDAYDLVVRQLADLGIDAIETRHPDLTPSHTKRFTALAKRFGLLASGGSDYHGSRKAVELGSQRVPIACYQALRDAAGAG